MDYNINDIRKYILYEEFLHQGIFSEADADDYAGTLNEEYGITDFNYAFGATKLVIIPEDTDYVIKIPFNAIENCDADPFEDEFYVKFSLARTANGENFEWDYCALEEELYNIAKSAGWGKFFLPVEKVKGLEDPYPIYIQEKAQGFGCHSCNDKILDDKLRDFCLNYRVRYGSPEWWADVFESLHEDEDDLISFLIFLRKNEMEDDLHGNNLGYTMNDFPVIVDYAGFKEYS